MKKLEIIECDIEIEYNEDDQLSFKIGDLEFLLSEILPSKKTAWSPEMTDYLNHGLNCYDINGMAAFRHDDSNNTIVAYAWTY